MRLKYSSFLALALSANIAYATQAEGVSGSTDNNTSLFESKETKSTIPNIIINTKKSAKPSNAKVEVEVEDPDWGFGEEVLVSFEAKTQKQTTVKTTVDKTKKIVKTVVKKQKKMTVRQALTSIKKGENVGSITIPFSTYVKIGGENRRTLGNRVIIRGDDGLDYHLYKGRLTTKVPVDIDTLLMLSAEALEHNRVSRLNYLRGRSVPIKEDIGKILQLVEASPFTKEQNKEIGIVLGIDSDQPEYLTLLDIYAAMDGQVITKGKGLPKIASHPRKEDSPHWAIKAKKSNIFSEYDDFVILRHGAYILIEKWDLKSWFGGYSSTSLFHSLWMFADWDMLSSAEEYQNWQKRIDFKKKMNSTKCVKVGKECIEL